MENLHQYIARNHNVRYKFSRLHADWLQQKESEMATVTTSNDLSKTLNQSGAVGGSPNPGLRAKASNAAVTVPEGVTISIKPVDRRTIEGSTPGDFRSQAVGASMPTYNGPRDTPQQSEVGPC